MVTQVMVQPSGFLASGVRMRQLGDIAIFRFTDELQERLEHLIERSKTAELTESEQAELTGITDLARIFTFINAQLAAKAQWCLVQPEL
ncbi:MAG: hypothetical protein HC824_22045 [Synechococcales cyanobacterium RM1_1_8]|nr:hypothetical protein [Synechococcales cyanobacterium RM1_1_8]